MDDKKVNRLILKDDDVLVIYVPTNLFTHKKAIKSFYTQIKKQLLPRKNKILMLPEFIKMEVIGKDQIQEYISQVDLWNLFDEDGDEVNDI